MTTLPTDFIRLCEDEDGRHIIVNNYPCVALGYEWPPPEGITVGLDVTVSMTSEERAEQEVPDGMIEIIHFRRMRYSQLSDEDAAASTFVVRGAEYARVTPLDGERTLIKPAIPTIVDDEFGVGIEMPESACPLNITGDSVERCEACE
jgi:hypothetical protein